MNVGDVPFNDSVPVSDGCMYIFNKFVLFIN